MGKTNLRYHRFLDGEALFRKYFEEMGAAGSMAKLVEFCVSQGQKNPRTGKPPTRMGVWKAMWAWALDPANIKTSKQIFEKGMSYIGEYYTDDEWKKFAITKARGGLEFGKARYKKFEEAVR